MGDGRPNGMPAGPPDIDVERFDAAKRSSLDIFCVGVENWPIVNGLTVGCLKPEMPSPTEACRVGIEDEDVRRPCEPPRVKAKLWSTGSRPMASRLNRLL